MQSKAGTVEQYLAELPADRREVLETVRSVILKNLDKGYEEGMQYGMIGYFVPHRLYPAGYHCDPNQPLPFISLASQKNYMSLYMMCVYSDTTGLDEFRQAWAATGKKLDMGKSCIRFRKAEDLALDLIGRTIKRMPAKKWIQFYETTLQEQMKSGGAAASRKKGTRSASSRTKRDRRPDRTGTKAATTRKSSR